MELQAGLDTWGQVLPELQEGVLLGQGAFEGPFLGDNPKGDVLYLFPVFDDEAVAQMGRVLLVLPHEFLELAVPEAAEHVVDIVDAHIYSDDAGPESTVADAGGRLQILLEMLLQIQADHPLLAASLALYSNRLLLLLAVEHVQLGKDLGAREWKVVRLEGEAKIRGLVGVGQEGGEVVAEEGQVEAEVVVPLAGEDEGEGAHPVGDVLLLHLSHHNHLFVPDRPFHPIYCQSL